MVAPGQLIADRYRLDRQIGRGGFAVVYLATDLRLDRRVALKILDPAPGIDGDFLRRFADEGRILASLDHPHILAIHDSGEVGGSAYLVMPYVAGGTLADVVRARGRADADQIADWLRQAAAALDHAHARGLVHRDVKPQNLLVRDDGNLLLADFGVAKALSTSGTPGTTRAIGTVSYMAPEQFDGKVSPATDIYALGCVLCELLSGAPPFTGTTQQILRGHVLDAPPILAARGVSDLAPGVQAVLERALAKVPAERFATAADLARAFSAAVTLPAGATDTTTELAHARPTLTVPPAAVTSPIPRASATPRSVSTSRRFWPLAALLALLVVLASGILGAARLARGGPAITPTSRALAAEAPATIILTPSPTAALPTATAVPPTLTATVIPTIAPTATVNVAPTQTRAAEIAAIATLTAPTAPAQPTGTIPPAPTPIPPTATNLPPPPTPTAAQQPVSALSGSGTFRGTSVATLTGHQEDVLGVAWSPDNTLLASASYDDTVRLWGADGTPRATLRGHTDGVIAVSWSPDSSTVASAAADNDIRLWSRSGQARGILRGHTSSVICVAWSPNGRIIASGSGKISAIDGEDFTVRLWDAEGRSLATLRGHTASVMSVAWSPDGTTLASASQDGTIRLWTASGQPRATLSGHSGKVVGIAWSPDGRTLASAGEDRTVRLWSAAGRPVATLSGHGNGANAVAWSPDGSMLASGAIDRTIRLWTAEGKPIATLSGHTASVRGLAWSPDGRTLASASLDGTIRLWR